VADRTDRWSTVGVVGAPVAAIDDLERSSGFSLPTEYRNLVSNLAGGGLLGSNAYFIRRADGDLRPVDRDLGTLLIPPVHTVAAPLETQIFCIDEQTLLFDEFVTESPLGLFLKTWRREMVLVFRNSNPQMFTFLDFRFDPDDPPVIAIDTSWVAFNMRGSVNFWEGIDYIADSFASLSSGTSYAHGIEYWDSFDSLAPPSRKAMAWWDWRDQALKPYEEAVSLS